jgi:hypothetical protein
MIPLWAGPCLLLPAFQGRRTFLNACDAAEPKFETRRSGSLPALDFGGGLRTSRPTRVGMRGAVSGRVFNANGGEYPRMIAKQNQIQSYSR